MMYNTKATVLSSNTPIMAHGRKKIEKCSKEILGTWYISFDVSIQWESLKYYSSFIGKICKDNY